MLWLCNISDVNIVLNYIYLTAVIPLQIMIVKMFNDPIKHNALLYSKPPDSI